MMIGGISEKSASSRTAFRTRMPSF